ncbi:hypothetical protein IQ264_01045 [Phormidium sp. LEGE 05292]|uniref:hypothetical protein n=1 Tax=[Phormidium] sp. LEGE 05292 TaxID=767427 RepID=UPI00187F734D|nr:hypothetical protein [Phormidium sp. LEGE 05292]MBE9224061.1 hypothetical protein [Phormidium sp. LEGE 05292]
MSKLPKNPDPIHPKEFRRKYNFSVYQMHRLSGIPIETLKHYLADQDTRKYVEPKPNICLHFGEIAARLNNQNL